MNAKRASYLPQFALPQGLWPFKFLVIALTAALLMLAGLLPAAAAHPNGAKLNRY